MENRLGDETSPYLRAHAQNPVFWQPWDELALAQARQSNKPILLSVGYAACHWCHVMARESFADPKTAELMNRHFINIKLDREERPDLDAVYMNALHLMGRQGGWPMTIFLTPQAEPFWGGTYFPDTPRFGLPAFREVLEKIAAAWDAEKEQILQQAHNIKTALQHEAVAPVSRLVPFAAAGTPPHSEIVSSILNHMDKSHGGIAGAPKFPQASLLDYLLRIGQIKKNKNTTAMALLTIRNICEGGIYDHLGGGFARYATDHRWMIPHFEKMLYDNALILSLLTKAWRIERDALFKIRAAETIEWLFREMLLDDGFAASLDADSDGEEGKFYVWKEGEIDNLLGSESSLFKETYDITPQGNWEGKNILNCLNKAGGVISKSFSKEKKILFDAREKRVRPRRDEKILSDWNGLIIAALVEAGLSFDQISWIQKAKSVFDIIRKNLSRDGRLRHSWSSQACVARHPATLDDYAFMMKAAFLLHEATGEKPYLDQAIAWFGVLENHYHDKKQGAYFFSAEDTQDVIIRHKSRHDHAVPSGNAILCENLARLYHLTGDDIYQKRATEILSLQPSEVSPGNIYQAGILGAGLYWQILKHVVVIGSKKGPRAQEFQRALYQSPNSDLLVSWLEDAGSLPAGHPAAGKEKVDGETTAYVCSLTGCSTPVIDAHALLALLEA